MVTLRELARILLPPRVRRGLRPFKNEAGKWKTDLRLFWLRRKALALRPGSLVPCSNYTIRINDGRNYYTQYKDLFVKRIYHFEAYRPDPLILDCGSNIGMSVLYFKYLYPDARITAFEPDLAVLPYLEGNITSNSLSSVRLLHAAVAAKQGRQILYADGRYGSRLKKRASGSIPDGWVKYEVPCVRLWDYLTEPVDFLKMNIEGAEYEVLADSADRLGMVREMVIEYHHLPGLPRTLHKILALLHRQGFEYLINDFDPETNRAVHPPFRLTPETHYYLLIYARRLEALRCEDA